MFLGGKTGDGTKNTHKHNSYLKTHITNCDIVYIAYPGESKAVRRYEPKVLTRERGEKLDSNRVAFTGQVPNLLPKCYVAWAIDTIAGEYIVEFFLQTLRNGCAKVWLKAEADRDFLIDKCNRVALFDIRGVLIGRTPAGIATLQEYSDNIKKHNYHPDPRVPHQCMVFELPRRMGKTPDVAARPPAFYPGLAPTTDFGQGGSNVFEGSVDSDDSDKAEVVSSRTMQKQPYEDSGQQNEQSHAMHRVLQVQAGERNIKDGGRMTVTVGRTVPGVSTRSEMPSNMRYTYGSGASVQIGMPPPMLPPMPTIPPNMSPSPLSSLVLQPGLHGHLDPYMMQYQQQQMLAQQQMIQQQMMSSHGHRVPFSHPPPQLPAPKTAQQSAEPPKQPDVDRVAALEERLRHQQELYETKLKLAEAQLDLERTRQQQPLQVANLGVPLNYLPRAPDQAVCQGDAPHGALGPGLSPGLKQPTQQQPFLDFCTSTLGNDFFPPPAPGPLFSTSASSGLTQFVPRAMSDQSHLVPKNLLDDV